MFRSSIYLRLINILLSFSTLLQDLNGNWLAEFLSYEYMLPFRLDTAILLCCTDFNSKTSLTGFSDYNVDTQGIFPESSVMY